MHCRGRLNVLSIALCFGVLQNQGAWAQDTVPVAPQGAESGQSAPDATKQPDVADDAVQKASERFLTYYYLAPSPDRFVTEFREVGRSLKFNADGEALLPLSEFYGMVIRANPELTATWVDSLADLPDSYRPVLYYSLGLAATKHATEALRQLAQTADGEQKRVIVAILLAPKVDIATMPIQAPDHLDMLWGAFFATGDQAFVLRIIEALGREANDPVLAGAARWSLKSNAWQHSKVLGICRSAVTTAAAPVADELRGIVEEVDEILKTQPCPEPAAAPR